MTDKARKRRIAELRERVSNLESQEPGSVPEEALALLRELEAVEAEQAGALIEQRDVLLESMVDGVVTIDERGAMLSFNRAAEAMFGYAAADMLGQNVNVLMPSPYRERHDGYLSAYLETGVRRIIGIGRQVSGRRADGSEFPLELAVSEVWLRGERTFLGIVRDLSERQRLRDELTQLQKLEAVGRLASGIAHDFNNLLMGIMGCTSMAIRRLEEDSLARPYLDEIRGGAERGVALTRQLLDFSRRRPQHLQRCSINDVVRTTQVMLRQLIGDDIALRSQLAVEEPQVLIDFGRIEQILMNLATNARDAMPKGGDLVVRTRLDEGTVVLEVADTGLGMDEATRSRAFEPFFTTKPPNEGTGLGLSTVFGIAQRAHGRVELSSELGRGTRVTIRLPQVAADLDEADESAVLPRRGTILVADEEEVVRLTVRDYLEEAGFTVLEADHIETAKAVLGQRNETIGLLVVDLRLPGGGGAELARVAREARPELALLYLCTFSPPSNEAQDPPAPCVRKPVGQHTLLEAVVRALDEEKG